MEFTPATREEFYAEAAHLPATPQEQDTQRAKFRAWRVDPRFERFWPLIDRLLAADTEAVKELRAGMGS